MLLNNLLKLQRLLLILHSYILTRTPYEGIGKPEGLKHDLAGKWSRRINDEHRLVYQVQDENLIIYMCRYHY